MSVVQHGVLQVCDLEGNLGFANAMGPMQHNGTRVAQLGPGIKGRSCVHKALSHSFAAVVAGRSMVSKAAPLLCTLLLARTGFALAWTCQQSTVAAGHARKSRRGSLERSV